MKLAADHRFMSRALQLARNGIYSTDPNPRVGCVIVRDGRVVGEGWHRYAGGPHAEVNALAQAGEQAAGATIYISMEPCCHQGRTPPCSDALIAAGVKRVVVAMEDPNPAVSGKGLKQLDGVGIEVNRGLLQARAEALNPGFIHRMRQGRPFVRCKLAMSLDGRTAMASGESKWITAAAARADVQSLRARSSAIMTGVGTVLADDPRLTVRLDPAPEHLHQPLRVVLDSLLRTPIDARILHQTDSTIIYTMIDGASQKANLLQMGVRVITVAGTKNRLDLHAVMAHLAQLQVNEVLLEAGATLSGAMLQAGLIDEFVIYMAPLIMGAAAKGLFHLPGLKSMDQSIKLDITDIRAVGKDWRITACLQPCFPE